jgi:hypothetical protein
MANLVQILTVDKRRLIQSLMIEIFNKRCIIPDNANGLEN